MRPLTIALLLAILVGNFLLKSAYNLLSPSVIGGDSYDHFLFIEEIRAARHRIPDSPDQIATAGDYSYPYLLHWFLSFVPQRHIVTVDKYFSAVSDTVFLLFVAALAPLGFLSEIEVVVASLAFVAIPQFSRPDMSHNTGLSARKPGLLFVSVSVLATHVWIDAGSLPSLALAVVAGTTVLLSSKFGTQAYVALFGGLAVFGAVRFAAVPPLAFCLAVLLSKGKYLDVLAAQLRHLYLWGSYIQFRHPKGRPGMALPTISSVGDLLNFLYRNRFVNPMINNHVPITIAVLLIAGVEIGLPEPFGLWVLVGFAAYLVTVLPYLRFLGQPERYLEYTTIPVCVAVASLWSGGDPLQRALVAPLIAGGIAVTLAYVVIYLKVHIDPDREHQLSEVIEFLRTQPDGVLIKQPRGGSVRIAWETNHSVVKISLNAGSCPEINEQCKIMYRERMGLFTDDVEAFDREFSPEYALFESRGDPDGGPGLSPPQSEPLFENDRFALYYFRDLQ